MLAGLISITLVVSALVSVATAAPVIDARPNIILISADDMRLDDMWVMDNVRTLIAEQGTTFSRYYAPFPLCCPARASILTGQNAHNHGVLDNAAPLGGYAALDSTNTVATWLNDAGYQTAFAGKYLNQYGAARPVTVPPGWDDFHGIVGGGDYFNTRVFENGVATQYTGPYQTDLFADLSSDAITRSASGAAPFFLWSSFYAPHSGQPVEPDDPSNMQTAAVAPRHRDAFAGRPLPQDPSYNEADVSDKPAHIRNRQLLSTFTQAAMTEAYQQRLEALLALDEAVGKMMVTLEATGERDNTIVAFTSDNGFMLGEHRVHAGKTIPYEPSAHLPLVIRGPGFPVGVTRDQLAADIDLAPTFVDAGNATAGLAVDGTSLLPLAADPTLGAGRNLLVEAGPTAVGEPMFYTGVRTDQWLYVEYDTGETELYDMDRDPYQLRSLHQDPAYNDVRAELAAVLTKLRNCSGPTCRGGSPVPLGPDLFVSAVADPPSTVAQGSGFRVTDTTANNAGTAPSSTTRYYLSVDRVRNSGDRLLTGGRLVPSLAAGASHRGSRSVTVPRNAALGNYYLLACADDRLIVSESTETNNCRSSTLRVTITARPANAI